MLVVITAAALAVFGDHIKVNKDGISGCTCLEMLHGFVGLVLK